MQQAPAEVRDTGVRLAIEAAGGVAALARGLGIAQPSVSTWKRIPAERVAAVESLTGVSRAQLRPDLFGGDSAATAVGHDIDPFDQARAREYLLLARLVSKPPTSELLGDLAKLKGDASQLGMAHLALADAARATTATEAGEEYFKILVGVGRGEVLPYGSFYLTGFLNERPLAELRADLARLGVERRENVFEPEDHLGSTFEVMAGLIDGTFKAAPGEADAFFKKHVQTWTPRALADIGTAPSSKFYRSVAALGLTWLDIETEALTLPD